MGTKVENVSDVPSRKPHVSLLEYVTLLIMHVPTEQPKKFRSRKEYSKFGPEGGYRNSLNSALDGGGVQRHVPRGRWGIAEWTEWTLTCRCKTLEHFIYEFLIKTLICQDNRLCGLVIRVSGYRYTGLGFDSRRYQIFWVVVGLERGPLSLVRSNEELLE